MKMLKAIIIVLSVLVCSSNSRAAVFPFYALTYNEVAVGDGGMAYLNSTPVNLTISDDAVFSGAFNLSFSGNLPGSGIVLQSGDFASFISFHDGETVTPTQIQGHLEIHLLFDNQGIVQPGSSLDWSGLSNDMHLTGSAPNFSGSFGQACADNACFSGDFNSQVTETFGQKCAGACVSGDFGPLPQTPA
jgi:hypothetical protein